MGRKKDTGSRLPYFTFYPGDWLSSATVSGMTPEEEGTFVRLLCLAWVNDGLPVELAKVRALTKLSAARWKSFEAHVQSLFPLASDGRRRNARQESERNAAQDKTLRRATAGAKGAAKRWQADSNAIPMPMANDGYTQIQIQKQITEGKQQQAAVPPAQGRELAGQAAPVPSDQAEALLRTARLLTAAANKGIAEKYGEQPVPINAASVGSYRCTEALHEAGVDADFAAAAIFECAKTLLIAKPPRSLGYFLQHVLDRWTAAQAHREAAQFDPKQLPTTSSARPAEGDQLRYAAMRYAQEGSAEWQAYCDERQIDWKATA